MKTAEEILLTKNMCTIEEDADIDINENFYIKWNDVIEAMKEHRNQLPSDVPSDEEIERCANLYAETCTSLTAVHELYSRTYVAAQKEMRDRLAPMIAKLEEWKAEQIKLTLPLLELIHSHPESKIGDSVIETAIKLIKERDQYKQKYGEL